MGLSETIIAAMIGAIATVTTALFQIFSAFKARGKPDLKPRRGSAARSVLAILALMIASAAGGFLYSELLRQRGSEDIRGMRQELRELRELTAATVDQRRYQGSADRVPEENPSPQDAEPVQAAVEPAVGHAESVAYVPACRRNLSMNVEGNGDTGMDCGEADAQRIALCGTIPAAARVSAIELFAQPDAVQHPWTQHTAVVEQDIGGARFTGKTFEYAQGNDEKSVCVNFMHWSGRHPHIARILVQYRLGEEPEILTPETSSEPFSLLSQSGGNAEVAPTMDRAGVLAAPLGAVE